MFLVLTDDNLVRRLSNFKVPLHLDLLRLIFSEVIGRQIRHQTLVPPARQGRRDLFSRERRSSPRLEDFSIIIHTKAKPLARRQHSPRTPATSLGG